MKKIRKKIKKRLDYIMKCGIINNSNRGMDVKNLTPSCKVTIPAPYFLDLRRVGGLVMQKLASPPLVF